MIKVSVLYPNEEGKKFDMGYYFNKHIPMLQQKLGAACKRLAVEQGLGAQCLDHGQPISSCFIYISIQ